MLLYVRVDTMGTREQAKSSPSPTPTPLISGIWT